MNFDNAIAHAPAVALLTAYFLGFFLGAVLIMVGVLILLHDLAEGIRRLRRQR
jgi:hypothetical protein